VPEAADCSVDQFSIVVGKWSGKIAVAHPVQTVAVHTARVVMLANSSLVWRDEHAEKRSVLQPMTQRHCAARVAGAIPRFDPELVLNRRRQIPDSMSVYERGQPQRSPSRSRVG